MSADDSVVREVADAGSDVVVAAVTAAADTRPDRTGWSNNKVLLAVLPPTLALLSVALGVWDSGVRDRRAARDAREAAAAEAVKQQEAEQRAQDLRLAELVLPKYERLVTDVHNVLEALHRCQEDIQAWLVDTDEWNGTAVAPALISITTPFGPPIQGLPVTGATFLESCARIDDTVEPFQLSLDVALLVSSPDLEQAARGLGEQLAAATTTARHVRAAVRRSDSLEYINHEEPDSSGRSFYENVTILSGQVGEADSAARDLIGDVRKVQLIVGDAAQPTGS